MNNVSVYYAGLYINWAKTSLFIICGIVPTSNLPIKYHPLSRKLLFSDADLVSNYHGCKVEATKLTPYYMIDIIYKTVKASHLKKMQIVPNINNLMF